MEQSTKTKFSLKYQKFHKLFIKQSLLKKQSTFLQAKIKFKTNILQRYNLLV